MKEKHIKEYKGTVVVIKNNELQENIPFIDEADAHDKFLEQCKKYISNFDEYSAEDIDTILEDELEIFGHGEISISWF